MSETAGQDHRYDVPRRDGQAPPGMRNGLGTSLNVPTSEGKGTGSETKQLQAKEPMTKTTRQTRIISRLQDILELDTQLIQWVNDWAEGYAATSPGHGEPGRGKGGHSTPVEAAITGHAEGAGLAQNCLNLHDRITNLVADIHHITSDARRVQPISHQAASDLAKAKDPRNWGAGPCLVCGDWVPGIEADRLKLGMCPHHYGRFDWERRKHPGTDRHGWIAAERRRLTEPTTEGGEEPPA